MILDIIFLILSLLVILLCCILFVNSIELFGKRFNLHQGIVGSILAAVGTALPETIIPIIAILFSPGKDAHNVGIGAIAGAPFMLGTLGFFVTGIAIIIYTFLKRRSFIMNADINHLKRDLIFFLIYYSIAIGTTIFYKIIFLKIIIAFGLLLSYPIYLRCTIKGNCGNVETEEILFFTKYLRFPFNTYFIIFQLIISLALLILGAHFFVVYVQELSHAIGVSALVLSLIITPIATELPEKLNSIIWVGKNKDTLALGNITGAMVFQSCFPVVFGMIFTNWHLTGTTLVSAACAISSTLLILFWILIKKSINPFVLCFGGIFYAILIFHIVI